MLNVFIFLVLPYAALILFLCVTPYRYFSNRLTWSAYSTQFLERNKLSWGINPLHYGLLPVLAAHGLGFLFPGLWLAVLGHRVVLVGLESLGLGLGLFTLLGCVVLLIRRSTAPQLLRVTVAADWALLLMLAIQSFTGVYLAVYMRWGSLWYLHAVVPYLYSLATLHPNLALVADFPLIFKLHVAQAFLIVGILPFTKLVHILYSPLAFLWDAPILYRWRSNHLFRRK
jgi:nitrate reductase gamma subunit